MMDAGDRKRQHGCRTPSMRFRSVKRKNRFRVQFFRSGLSYGFLQPSIRGRPTRGRRHEKYSRPPGLIKESAWPSRPGPGVRQARGAGNRLCPSTEKFLSYAGCSPAGPCPRLGRSCIGPLRKTPLTTFHPDRPPLPLQTHMVLTYKPLCLFHSILYVSFLHEEFIQAACA